MASSRRFVRKAPSKVDKTRLVDIRTTDMTANDALWWDSRLGPKHAQIRTRADRFWPWSVLLPMCHLVQLAQRRYCRPLVTWARADSGRFLRTGMSILIEHYPYLNVSKTAQSHFVWFISSADPSVLQSDFGMSHPPALARLLLDNAIVLSQNSGLEGRVGLHAAAAGGAALMNLYGHCGLLHLRADADLPPSVRRPNDGRFFFADEPVAETLADALDASR
ncbi:MAG: hypothetical protein QOD95_1962 [Gammaproteobacteria bacterium]|jgi:hypothetical protein|nr:hypothetical protein [Gammaproteobacteria bacterium]